MTLPETFDMHRFDPARFERRIFKPEDAELRAKTEDDKSVLSGYAARFNSLSVTMDEGDGAFQERILPGAFTRSLESDLDVIALAHHDEKLVLGRRSAGTLKLIEDEHGLRTLIYPPDTTAGRDIVVSVDRRDLVAMSFGFYVDEEDEEYRQEDGVNVREIRNATLFEVSIVTWPAYPSTSIKVRSDISRRFAEVESKERSRMAFLEMLQKHAEKITH